MLILIATHNDGMSLNPDGIHTKAFEFSGQKEEDHDEKMPGLILYVRNNCKAGDESLFADAFAKGEEGKDEKGEITAAAVRKVKLPLDKFF